MNNERTPRLQQEDEPASVCALSCLTKDGRVVGLCLFEVGQFWPLQFNNKEEDRDTIVRSKAIARPKTNASNIQTLAQCTMLNAQCSSPAPPPMPLLLPPVLEAEEEDEESS